MTMENPKHEMKMCVFPIENGDFSASHVSFRGGGGGKTSKTLLKNMLLERGGKVQISSVFSEWFLLKENTS